MARVINSRTSKQCMAPNLTKARHGRMKPTLQKSEWAILKKRQYRRRQKDRNATLKAFGPPERILPYPRMLKWDWSDRVKKTNEQERQDWLTHRKQERRWLEEEIMRNKFFRVSKRQKAAFIQITRSEDESDIQLALCDDNDRVSKRVKELFIMVIRERGRARAAQGMTSYTDPVEDWWGPGKPPIDHQAVLEDNSMDDLYVRRPPAPKEEEPTWTTLGYQAMEDTSVFDQTQIGPLLPGVEGPEVQVSTGETAEPSDSRSEAGSENTGREQIEVAGVEEESDFEEEWPGAKKGEREIAEQGGWTWRWESMEKAGLEEVDEEVQVEEVDEEPKTPEAQIGYDYYT